MWYVQPQGGPANIDQSNPITRGLKFVQLGTRAETQGDWKAGAISTVAIPRTSRKGIGYGVTGAVPVRTIDALPTTGGVWSVFAVTTHDGVTSGAQNVLDNDDSGSGGNARQFQFRVNAASVEIIRFNNIGSPFFATGTAMSSAELLAGVHMGAVCNGTAFSVFTNGRKTSGTITGTPSTGTGAGDWRLGNSTNGTSPWKGSIPLLLIFDRALSDQEMVSLNANPWQVFDVYDDLLFAASSGATDTQVNPGVGALALTGYAPTVARTANQALTPAQGSLAITGYAPTVVVGLNRAVAPGVGSLSITGYAPSVTQAITTAIAPGAGSLSLTGYAPSIAQSVTQSATPDAGTLTLTGYAPTLAQSANQALSPAAGVMVITGYAPVVTQVSASPSLVPGTGSITITGYEPTITQSGGAGRPKRKFQVETSRGVIEVATMDEVAEIVRTEKRRPKAAPVEVKLDGMKVSTPSLKPNVDYKAIEERTRAQVQAEMDDEEELLMMLL